MSEGNKSLQRFTLIVFGIILLYGILRLHVFAGLPWSELPLYTFNKALAWGALNFIGLAFAASLSRFFEADKFRELIYTSAFLMQTGFFLLLLHVGISFLLLAFGYFPELIGPDGVLTANATISFFAAVVASVLLLFYFLRAKDRSFVSAFSAFTQKLYFPPLLLFLILMHPFFIGFDSWFQDMSQAGYMPRISFLAVLDGFSVLLLVVYLSLKVQRNRQ
jgi:hypothetical protein